MPWLPDMSIMLNRLWKIAALTLTIHDCSSIMVSMNKLPTAKRCQVISALVEGCSIRSIVRMTGVAKNTIIKLLGEIGVACSEYEDNAMHGLQCRRLEMDEIWAFCYSKQKNVPESMQGTFGIGDVW